MNTSAGNPAPMPEREEARAPGARVPANRVNPLVQLLAALPTIAFLASLTAFLSSCSAMRSLEAAMISTAVEVAHPFRGSAAESQDEKPGNAPRISVLMIPRTAFQREWEGKLPVDKEKLAALVRRLGEAVPRVVAIDIDAIPVQPAPPPKAPRQADEPPLVAAIRSLLEKGISVVALDYHAPSPQEAADHGTREGKQPGAAQKERKERGDGWRSYLCDTTRGEAAAKLYWASPFLDLAGESSGVLRYPTAHQAEQTAAAGQGLLPLGLVVAAAAQAHGASSRGTSSDSIERSLMKDHADHCKSADDRLRAGMPLQGGVAPPPNGVVNYFAKDVIEFIPLEHVSDEELKQFAGKVVVVGIDSYPSVDEHPTPIGRQRGAVIHALIAQSFFDKLSENHLLAWGVDVALGAAFVLLFFLFHAWGEAIRSRAQEAFAVARVVSLLVPLVPLVLLVPCVVVSAPILGFHGLWLNPLPMVIGLAIHLYAELTQSAHGGGASSAGEFLRAKHAEWKLHWMRARAVLARMRIASLRDFSDVFQVVLQTTKTAVTLAGLVFAATH